MFLNARAAEVTMYDNRFKIESRGGKRFKISDSSNLSLIEIKRSVIIEIIEARYARLLDWILDDNHADSIPIQVDNPSDATYRCS
mgnify:CR=1 FL=1